MFRLTASSEQHLKRRRPHTDFFNMIISPDVDVISPCTTYIYIRVLTEELSSNNQLLQRTWIARTSHSVVSLFLTPHPRAYMYTRKKTCFLSEPVKLCCLLFVMVINVVICISCFCLVGCTQSLSFSKRIFDTHT